MPVESRGYGNALAGGIAAARGDYVIMGDADDSYDFATLGPFVEQLRDGNDLVVGNRFQGGIEPGAMPCAAPLPRQPGALLHRPQALRDAVRRHLLRAARRSTAAKIEALDLRAGGMEFAIEMVVKATMQGLRVDGGADALSPDGRDRTPHLRHLARRLAQPAAAAALQPALAVPLPRARAARARARRHGVARCPRQRTVGGVTFDVSTLLYCALAVVVGLQAVYFFFTARWFGITEGLLPDDPRLRRLIGRITLERGLAGRRSPWP